ncbi:MAG: class I SAM-dependent methyltransferase [Terracidiphilus sp.]
MAKLKYLVPKPLRRWLNRRRQAARRGLLVLDRVTDWSVLRSLRPYRADFGVARGDPIDRYYIEKFLAVYRESIRGRVAEIESDQYTRLFGSGVERSDILDLNEQNERRTLTIDLTQTAAAPEDAFDCIICTQTLLVIEDYAAAVRSLHKMLRPGGVLLVTVPGICQIVRGGMIGGVGEDWWRFTGRSAGRIFNEVFSPENVTVHTYGNVLTAIALLHGLVQQELTREELEFNDPDYEVTIGVKAVKRAAG